MKQNRAPVIIGITGNSGSGKTLIAQLLEREHGALVIDADRIAHKILEPNLPAYGEVLGLFGDSVLADDGRLDRRKIAEIVFTDTEILKKHMEITHKYILAEMRKKLDEYKSADAESVVIDAPLLIESGFHVYCDYVWLVTADYDKKAQRLAVRDNLEPETAKNRLRAQSSQDKLEEFADSVICNNAGIEVLYAFVLDLYRKIILFPE